MSIALADERPHAGALETWSLAFVGEDGFAGRVATTVAGETTQVSVMVLHADAGPIIARDALPSRAEPFELRGDGIWVNQWCETPFEHWTYGLEAFGVQLDRPQDAFEGELGTRVAVGWDLEWETGGAPFDLGAGYVQPGIVHGEVLIGSDAITFDGFGVRSHHWGTDAPGPAMWWHDERGDAYVVGERAVRWSVDAPALVDVRGYDSTVDTRGFPARVDLVVGADALSFDINPFAWAAEIVNERPLRIVAHTAFAVSRDGRVIGRGWETGAE